MAEINLKRGFASPKMNPERQREIASSGGKAAHLGGKAYKWTSETARQAALKGIAKRRENALKKAEEAQALSHTS